MQRITKVCPRQIGTNSAQLVQLFSETMDKRQISGADWYELLTAPWNDAYSTEAQDTINRMIYGVRHGIVKVVDTF